MRTLKKTLCLVLVLTMMVGLCAFGASATKFTDADKIQHTDAVTVMTGMGVIKGNADGTFNPEGTLRRAEAAVILVRMLGMDDITANSSFTDMDNFKWAQSAVALCEAEGIVLGVGGGKFNPGGKLTGSAWGKMLLKAIGYEDPDLDSGSKWEIAVAKGIKAAGLKEGLDSFDGTAAISRDDACQMAWNGLNYAPNGKTSVYVVKNVGGTELYRGADAITALLMKQETATNTLTLDTVSEGSLGAENFNLVEGKTTDEFGRTSIEYSNGKTGKAKVVYGTIGDEAAKTYTAATTLGKVAADLGYGATATNTFNVFVDGIKTSYTNVGKADTTALGGAAGARGSLIEVYNTAANTYDVIVINTYVKKLVAADITAAVAATSTTDAQARKITLSSVDYKTNDFKAGDVVLYTKGSTNGTTFDVIPNVVKADYFTGTVSATASSYFRVDGEQKYLSANSGLTIGAGRLVIDAANTYYTDSYGNVIYVEAGTTAAVETKFTYLIDTASKAAKSSEGSNLFESNETAGARAQAKIVDIATGEIKVVNLGIVKGTDGKYYYATASGAASTTQVTNTKPVAATTAPNGLYEYAELDNGDYVLVKPATTSAVSVSKGTAAVGANIATSSTKLTVVTLKLNSAGTAITSAAITNYTGIGNFPGTSTSPKAFANAYVVADTTTKVISTILAVQTETPTTSATYAVYAGEGETDSTGTKVAFYVNGEQKQYYLASTVTVASLGLTEGDVVTLSLTGGKVSAATKETGTKITVDVLDSTFVAAGSTIYYFASSYEVYDATNYAKTTIAAGDTVTLFMSAGKVAYVLVG